MTLEFSLNDVNPEDKNFIRRLETIGFPGKVKLTEEKSDVDIYLSTSEGKSLISLYHNFDGEYIHLGTYGGWEDINLSEFIVKIYKKIEKGLGKQKIAIRRDDTFDKQRYYSIVGSTIEKLLEYVGQSN